LGEVSTDIGWLQKQHAWPNLAAIEKMVRAREIQAKTATETSYYLLSTPLSAARFIEVVCAQWGIENGLHWVLDVTMNEDRKRNCKDNGPENIGLSRRLALNLARSERSKGSLRESSNKPGGMMNSSVVFSGDLLNIICGSPGYSARVSAHPWFSPRSRDGLAMSWRPAT
jgi:predicted transposase YbfD/YdcC